jgi:nucleoid DNA-binding protein
MIFDDLVSEVADRANVSGAIAREVLYRYHEVMTAALMRGDDFEIRGIGRLTVRDMPARSGRNPQTGEPIEIPAGRRVAFGPSAVLKRALHVNGEIQTE